MKKLFFVVSLMMVLVIAPMAMADQVKLYRVDGYFSGGGGEFTILRTGSGDPDLDWVFSLYDSKTKDIGGYSPSFQSFCVERNEFVDMDTTYSFTFNSAAVAGGLGGGNPDPLSLGAAYLYDQFRQGILTGYNYTPGSTERAASALALQDAIWWLEDENINYSAANPFMLAVFDMWGNNAKDPNNQYPVRVLNLYTYDQERNIVLKQDVLVAVPEPATMLLLGSGLIGLAGYARKRFKK